MTPWKPGPVRECLPYETLARIYDFVMRHVDYVEWAEYIEAVFERYDARPDRLVEVACGTGTLAIGMVARGYAVHGIDLSPGMIARAEEKAALVSPRPTFAVGDMRDLPPDEAAAILCLYDSINYNLTPSDLRRTFVSFRGSVRTGALCIFDVTTETNSIRYFRNYRSHERWKEYIYRRQSRYIAAERLQINEFSIRARRRRRGDRGAARAADLLHG